MLSPTRVEVNRAQAQDQERRIRTMEDLATYPSIGTMGVDATALESWLGRSKSVVKGREDGTEDLDSPDESEPLDLSMPLVAL